MYIRGSAIALHCCKVHAKINRKIGNLTPCKILTRKISSWNFAHVIMSARLPAMQILVSISTVGTSPQIGEILPPCDFFDCPVLTLFSRSCAQVEPLNRFSRFKAQMTCFHARMVLLGLEWWVTISGGNMPPKWAWIGNFKPKRQKSQIHYCCQLPSWKKWTWPHNSSDYHLTTAKFGRQMQSGMAMTIHRLKSKLEIEFQYGGRPFSRTGSSFISALDWDQWNLACK